MLREITTIRNLFILLFVFLTGVFSSSIYASMQYEQPAIVIPDQPEISGELKTPGDWIQENQIKVYRDRVQINIDNPQWASFTPTGSMEPFLDEYSHAIEIIPESEDDISVGDIVSYNSDYTDGPIIHRVVYKGQDEQGTYFVMKGDNNPTSDPGRVRFDQINRVLVAIIY